MKKCCEDLKKHAIEIINYRKKEKKMTTLTPEKNKLYLNNTNSNKYHEEFGDDNEINRRKEIIFIIQLNIEVWHIVYEI